MRRIKLSNRNSQRSLLPFFWILVSAYTVFLIYTIYKSPNISFEDIFGGISISIASVISVYLWCAGKAFGLPIFPLFSITYLWTCAIPLVTDNPSILKYDNSERLLVGLTVSGFLLLATFIWYQFVNNFPHPEEKYRVLDIKRGDNLFLSILVIANFYTITSLAGWLNIDSGSFSIIRGAILGLTAIATFAMSYRYGSGKLSSTNRSLYITSIVLLAIVNTISLLLVNALTLCLISVVAYSVGKGKFPVISTIIMLGIFSVLHAGKAEMRELYWQQAVEPWEYPSRYVEWIEFGFKDIFQESKEVESEQSLLERASVIQQLLLTQSETDKGKPLLEGITYAIIPQLLVPRIFNSEKITSHEGTSILNIYYGRQTRKDTQSTTIGWGLLAEAYANFGLWGCVLLAFISGAGYGYVSLLSVNAPVFSDRYLFAILVLSYAFQTEFTAGVYVAALFQSSVTLLGFVLVFMKVKKRELVES
ncbi:hypothetical protein HCU40_01925 [Pseudanabaena biceps]|nr:hypothetical protein [Pseudanabaena biceps]